jgi:hypothetical protein
MIICFRIGGQEHCYDIPVFEIPLIPYRPGPGPINYPAFIYDASVVALSHAAAAKVADERVRGALQDGIKAAVEALKKRGGEHISRISLEGTAGGGPTGGGAHGPGRK